MKILYVFLLALCLPVILRAQVGDKKSLDSACACVKRIDPKLGNEEYEEAAKQCIVGAMMQNPDFIEMATKAGDKAGNMGEEMGKEFAMELMQHCPESVTMFMRIGSSSDNDSKKSTEGSSSTGTLERIDTKGYVTVVLKVEGREVSFLWLRHFDGADKLKEGLGKMKGKKVTLRWKEIECYNPVLKDYVKMKEITAMRVVK